MVEGGGGTEFPVIFFDGEREINIGNIQVHPMLQYKAFQWMLSQRIGISPNQISIYLIDRKNSKSSYAPEERRKIPITSKANFSLICREKNICFLVVLKRSRKGRSRKARSNGGDFSPENDFLSSLQPENVILLRRNQAQEMNYLSSNSPTFYDKIAPADLASLNERLQSLRIQREKYASAMAKPSLNPNDFPRIEEIYSSMTMTKKSNGKVHQCKECESLQKNGGEAAFHHCLNDDVVVGFRCWAGPVGWQVVKSSS